MTWDTIIAIIIIGGLILTVWARVSHMTIPELISDLVDRIRGRAEDTVDEVREISF